jgi:hypothetical protein
VIEHLAPKGAGPPLHVHHREDEWFYIIEGNLTFWVGGRTIEASPGSFVYGPRDIPHTLTVNSPKARFLLVAEPAGFENFMRTLAVPAQTRSLPPAIDFGSFVSICRVWGRLCLRPMSEFFRSRRAGASN